MGARGEFERVMVILDCVAAGEAGAEALGAMLAGMPARSVLVQLRDKQATDEELRGAATRLRRVTRAHGARLVINSLIDLAAEIGADGVHLPDAPSAIGRPSKTGTSLLLARRAIGAQALVGQSRHSVDGVLAAAAEGADYVTIGPVWATPGKDAPHGIHIVRDAAYELRVATDRGSQWSGEAAGPPAPQPRLFALGGIDSPGRAVECVRAGAHGVAVIRAATRAAELLAAMEAS